MNVHLEKKVMKFNKKKHKRDPWMTYGILNSNTGVLLYYKKKSENPRVSTLCPPFSAFKELEILMLEDLYKIYYINVNSVLPVSFIPDYNTAQIIIMILDTLIHAYKWRKGIIMCHAQNQYLKLILETSQFDLDLCLTSNIAQFIAHFKYTIITSYNPMCNIRNCYVYEQELH